MSALTYAHVTRIPDDDCWGCCLFGSCRCMAGGGADADRQRTLGCSIAVTAAHRDQSASDLSALRELVCDSVSAQRPGAVPRETLLVAAVAVCLPGRRDNGAPCCALSPLRERAAPASPQTRMGEGGAARPLTR